MSAGSGDEPRVNRDASLLAPAFRAAVERSIKACESQGLDAYVFEGYRSQELQALYYQRGRTIIPPQKPVTNAQSNLYSWHGYGLAVDVISRAHAWDRDEAWFASVAQCFKANACRWGGDWEMRDLPHFQWGACKPSPSDIARDLMRTQGVQAVWKAVGADGIATPTAATADTGAVTIASSGDGAVDNLKLADGARQAALILRARYPTVQFTSGRRNAQEQASAMASNVVLNRRWIEQTYRTTPLRDRCQAWVDANPGATQAAIAQGLVSVFSQCSDEELRGISKHLSGHAFDVQPVLTADGETIKSFIRSLPRLERFLDSEGGLTRWHAQFFA